MVVDVIFQFVVQFAQKPLHIEYTVAQQPQHVSAKPLVVRSGQIAEKRIAAVDLVIKSLKRVTYDFLRQSIVTRRVGPARA